MRLIDADKLKEELEVNGLGYQYYMLDNAPTVKAIPKEWIIDWMSKRNDFPTMPYNQHIWNMFEDWEKENETN